MTTPAAQAEQILNWTYADAQSRAQAGLERIDALAAQYPDDPAVTDVGTMLTRLADSVARTTGGTVTVQLRDAGMLSGGEFSEQIMLADTCPHCGCPQHEATELAAWEHEARGAHGEWVAMGGGGWEGRDRALQDWFHPQQLDATQVKHPRSGYMVDSGLSRRVSRPPESQHGNESLGIEGPPTFDVIDHGDPNSPEYNSLRYMNPQPIRTEPIQHVYRGISEAEWQQAQQRGYLQSDARGTISQLEGTNAAVDPSSAVSYLPREGNSRVVKIAVRPEDKWFTIRADNYLRTRQPIPLDRVEAVSPPIRKHGKYDELQVRQDAATVQTANDAWEHEARGKGGEWIGDLQARHPGVQLELSRKPTGNVQLSLIRTKGSRGQGLADAAMRDLTQQADRTGTTLQLTPEPLAGDRTTSKTRLTAWYARHGFKPNRGRHMDYSVSDTMVRPPAAG